MFRNIFLGYGLLITCVFAWETWQGHHFGNDESAGWTSSGATQYHK